MRVAKSARPEATPGRPPPRSAEYARVPFAEKVLLEKVPPRRVPPESINVVFWGSEKFAPARFNVEPSRSMTMFELNGIAPGEMEMEVA